MQKIKTQKTLRQIALHLICILLSALFCFPFVYMVLTSFQPTNDAIFALPPKLFPETFAFSNYSYAFKEMEFPRAFGNTMLILVTATALNMCGSTCVAYGFSRFNAKGKGIAWTVLMATMMLSWVVTMVPAFVIFKFLGWIGTRLPLIIPAFGGSAYNIFMLRQFMMGIPRDLDEAAKIDGCSSVGILIKILMPNMMPVFATLFIFLFTSIWSDYLAPSIYLVKKEQHTLSLALYNLRTAYAVDWKSTMAGSAMFAIPMVIVLFAMQRFFVEGIVVTGIK